MQILPVLQKVRAIRMPDLASAKRRLLLISRFAKGPRGFRLANYCVIAAAALTPAFVWTSFSRLETENGSWQMPYHGPAVIMGGLVLLEVALIIWVKMLAFGNERTQWQSAPIPAGNGESDRRESRGDTASAGAGPGSVSGLERDLFGASVRAERGDLLERHRQRRVLVVDDDPVARLRLRKQLIRLGISSESVANGNEAVAAVACHTWDMILMDGHMPAMDGLTAAQEIRERGLMPATTPIIIVTSDDSRRFHEKCLAAPIDGLYHKPLNLLVLQQLVVVYLGQPVDMVLP